nr:glycogen synthase [uncultured Desulfobulbus sp.]
MYIIMISAECAPVAKVGGLADVVFGLSRELSIRGNAVEIILPKYDCMRYDHIWGLQLTHENLWVPWFNYFVHCSVYFGFVHGLKCFFIEPHCKENFFNRGSYYGFPDEALRMAFFTKAAMEFMLKTNKRPDIIHSHDWQTALAPVLLYEIYQHIGMQNCRAMHTIHNFKHQGIAGKNILWFTGLGKPEYYYDLNRLKDDFNPSAINFTKGAIVYANFTSTVSPRYAWEVRHSDQGYGLGHILHIHQHKFGGILNGLDYDMWNPETDPHIPAHYNHDSIENKYANKEALRERLWLEKSYKPLIAYVGRLDGQKGVHLIRHALLYAINHGAQFVMLGSSPEAGINNDFWDLKHMLNDNVDCHLEIGYNEELAHLIYAGADMIVVPSIFEPCGLTQVIALRYGTVPIVRAVGGLLDTVFDRDYSDKPEEERNGYVFHEADFQGIESALVRAIGLWNHHPEEFKKLMLNGIQYDYSWNIPGQNYLKTYEWIRHK